MNDIDDPIGIETTGHEWELIAYLLFASAMLIAIGVMFGAYVL